MGNLRNCLNMYCQFCTIIISSLDFHPYKQHNKLDTRKTRAGYLFLQIHINVKSWTRQSSRFMMRIKRMQILLSGFDHISSHISHHHHNLLENNLQIQFQILSTVFTSLRGTNCFLENWNLSSSLKWRPKGGPFTIYLFLPSPFPSKLNLSMCACIISHTNIAFEEIHTTQHNP